jgi:hypothetical protein
MTAGSLVIVGTGYRIAGQTTPEALRHMTKADKLFFLADSVTETWLNELNPSGESLSDAYGAGKDRMVSYEEMIERMLSPVRKGLKVCGAFYGHPGFCAYLTHEAIRRARREGHTATMLPGISSTDCLSADVGIDASTGCQTFEATDFLIRKRKLDNSLALILLQIATIGVGSYIKKNDLWNPAGLRVLVEVLQKLYSPRHPAVIYEASVYPVCDPIIQRVTLNAVPRAHITTASTLYLPPKQVAPLNRKMVARLRID